MSLNPISPLSSKPLSECDDAEVNTWIAKRKGWAGNSLMKSDVWPLYWGVVKAPKDFCVVPVNRIHIPEVPVVCRGKEPAAAIATNV